MDDWQISRNEIKERGQYLLESGKWSDCNFLVGSENNQQIIPAHKLILAMASPVFEAMFYGGLSEKNDPIPILDVQIDAFKSLLEYIYTDKININSVDKACELCYGAKKYMLPHVVEQCTKYLWSDLCPKNACRAYEFAKLFEEPQLMEKSLQIICTKTLDVLNVPTFDDIDLNTLMTILDQQYLNIDTELDLFFAVNRYIDKHSSGGSNRDDEPSTSSSSNNDEQQNHEDQQEQAQIVEQPEEVQELPIRNHRQLTIRDAIKKIRFLTLTPQQFAEGPGKSSLLTQQEALAILMNVSSANSGYPMPEGFTTNSVARVEEYNPIPFNVSDSPNPIPIAPIERLHFPPMVPGNENNSVSMDEGNDTVETRKHYCVRTIRQQTDCLNTSVLDCSVTFIVDRSICITGVQVPTQVFGETNIQHHGGMINDRYSELLYAHLLDAHGSRLTYTHCTQRVRFDSLMEISFDRPVYIRRHRMYKIGVVFNKVGWYPMCTCVPSVTCDNVQFTFGVGSASESVRDGLIRAIVFTYTGDSL